MKGSPRRKGVTRWIGPGMFCAVVVGIACGQQKSEASLERRMQLLVNHDRQSQGLRPLLWHDQLAEVARAHSRELSSGKFFDHVSPTTGSPSDRIHRAGIPNRRTGENISRDISVELSQQHLMESPGHRANILSPHYTHIGIGIVPRGPYLFVTQKFINSVQPVAPERLEVDLLSRINSERASSEAPRLRQDPRLQKICQTVADQMNHRQDLDSDVLTRAIRRSGIDYLTVQVWVGVTTNPGQILEQPFIRRRRFNAIGIGLSTNRSKQYGLGATWIALAAVDLR